VFWRRNMQDRSASIDTLRQKSERCRAELKDTIEHLSQTLSDTTHEIKETFSLPHLREEARAYARQKTDDVVNTVKERVAENPLQSLALGAAVAYPLLGIIKKVPVPLALIAAGLFISQGRSPSARRKSDFSANPAGARRENGGLDESVGAATDNEPADRAQVTAGIPSEAGARAASAGARIADAASDTRDTVVDFVDRNPLLVGGLAMAVGGFIAASLPESRMENDLFETASSAVKDKGRKAAAEVAKGAKARLSEFADDISAAAQREGLTAEGLSEVVDQTTDKVASVVRRTFDDAIEATPTEDSEGSHYGGQDGRF
jgi:hypothetical protein